MNSVRLALTLLLLVALRPAHAAERIVTLAPHLAELVCAVDACNQLVGVVRYTDYPAHAAALPLVGDAVNLNLEQLTALRPDLVLAWEGGTSIQTISRVRKLGIPVETIAVQRVSDIATALHRVGQLTGKPDAARAAASRFQQRLQKLRDQHRSKNKIRAMYQIETDPAYTVSARSPIHEAIEICGGINVFGGLQGIAPSVGVESILAANPEAVVFAQQDDVAKIRVFWARWPQLRAQQRGTLYTVDANRLARQSPRLLEGITELCTRLDNARAVIRQKPAASRS